MKKVIVSILFLAGLAALYIASGGSLDLSTGPGSTSGSVNPAPAGSSTPPLSSDEAALKSLKF